MTTQFTITQAHRLTGKSCTTIRRHVANGELSYTLDKKGRKLFDASELIRCYGKDFDINKLNQVGGGTSRESDHGPPSVAHDPHSLAAQLQDQLNREIEERKRERASYEDQVEYLRTSLDKANVRLEHTQARLEDRTKRVGESEETVRSIEQEKARLEGRSARDQEDLAREKLRAKKYWRAWKAAESKSAWEKFFEKLGGGGSARSPAAAASKNSGDRLASSVSEVSAPTPTGADPQTPPNASHN